MESHLLFKIEIVSDHELIIYSQMKEQHFLKFAPKNAVAMKYYIVTEASQLLWYHTEKFVLHCKAIIDNSTFYNSQIVTDALEKSMNFLQFIKDHDEDVWQISDVLIKMKRHLQAILPVQGNTSHYSSKMRLEQLQATAQYIKTLPIIKQETIHESTH